MAIVIAVVAAAGIFGLVAYLSREAESRADVRATLDSFGDLSTEGARAVPVATSDPTGAGTSGRYDSSIRLLAPRARRLAPARYLARTERRLVQAGYQDPKAVDAFLSIRLVSLLLIPLFIVYLLAIGTSGGVFLLLSLLAAFLLVLAPEAILDNRVTERQDRIRKDLSDLTDLLTISMEAGLGFEQALARATTSMSGPLSDEMGRMLRETRMGSSRRDALLAVDARTDLPELRAFITALIQADTFGVSIAQVLRTQSQELRKATRLRAREKAQKAPVKLSFPLVACTLPALFIVVAGPAFIDIFKNLGHAH